MALVDGHIHVWDPRRDAYDWLDDEEVLNRPYLPADLDRGSSGVSQAVFVEASAADSLAEARWVSGLAPHWPELAGIVGGAPLEDGAAVRGHLEELAAIPKVVGVRRNLQGEQPEFFERPGLVEGLRETARLGLSFDACVKHHQLPALTALLQQVPELPVILDHLGKPPVAAGGIGQWRADLGRLAGLPSVVVKLSGVAPEADPDKPLAPQATPYLRAALDLFGPDRSLVGSDWPVSAATPHALRYDEWFALVLEVTESAGFPTDSVGHLTAQRVYRLPA